MEIEDLADKASIQVTDPEAFCYFGAFRTSKKLFTDKYSIFYHGSFWQLVVNG